MVTYHVHSWFPQNLEKGIRSSGSGGTDSCGATIWVLRGELRCSARVTSILNHLITLSSKGGQLLPFFLVKSNPGTLCFLYTENVPHYFFLNYFVFKICIQLHNPPFFSSHIPLLAFFKFMISLFIQFLLKRE